MSSYIREEARPWSKNEEASPGRVDFKSSCSAYPSRSVLEVIERYEGPTLFIKALLLI